MVLENLGMPLEVLNSELKGGTESRLKWCITSQEAVRLSYKNLDAAWRRRWAFTQIATVPPGAPSPRHDPAESKRHKTGRAELRAQLRR